MIDIPYNATCPKCKTKGIDNFNMIINITTEQPLKYFKKMPGRISLNPRTSLNSSWVCYDGQSATIICRNCHYSSTDYEKFEQLI